MKKIKLILSLIVVLTVILVAMPNVVKAASTVTLQKIEVTNASGDYKTGDKITIVATYSDTIQPSSDTAEQILGIKFGTYGSKLVYGTISGKTVTFTYTITDEDKGTLSFQSLSENLKDAEGNILINSPSDIPALTGGEIVANPMKWADTSDTEINITRTDDTSWRATLKLENIEAIDGHSYYYAITTTTEEPELTLAESNNILSTNDIYHIINFEKAIDITENYQYANVYFWLCEEQRNPDTNKYEQKLIIRAVKLDRPEQNKLGNRMKCFFFNTDTSTYVFEPCSRDSRKINLKIGKITDNSILLSIKNGETNCLQKLLNYAKSADSIYTGKVPVGSSNSITGNMDLVNKGYYYVYMQLEDENGKYYDVEDVSLYQANVGEGVGKNLFDYLSDDFKWNLTDEPVVEPTNTVATINTVDTTTANVKIPQTGESLTIFAIVGLAIAGGIFGFVKYRKNNV